MFQTRNGDGRMSHITQLVTWNFQCTNEDPLRKECRLVNPWHRRQEIVFNPVVQLCKTANDHKLYRKILGVMTHSKLQLKRVRLGEQIRPKKIPLNRQNLVKLSEVQQQLFRQRRLHPR